MLKAIGTLQLAIAPLFVVPAMTSQDGDRAAATGGSSLESQLDSTMATIEYLVGLRSAARAGDDSAVRAILGATESPRDGSGQRAASITSLQDDLSRLRFQLDRLLSDPQEVAVITAMPASVVEALGLGGARRAIEPAGEILTGRNGTGTPSTASSQDGTSEATAPFTDQAASDVLPNPMAARPDNLQGTQPTLGSTTGLNANMRAAMAGEIAPLDFVSNSSRQQGDHAVAHEDAGYVADPIHLGKLLVHAGRPAEAIQILKKHQTGPGATYWLARALQNQERETEAIALFRLLADDGTAGIYGRHAAQDLEFLEFKSKLKKK